MVELGKFLKAKDEVPKRIKWGRWGDVQLMYFIYNKMPQESNEGKLRVSLASQPLGKVYMYY